MKTRVQLITPAIASEMLKKNKINRLLKERLVSEYSRLMTAGLWREETGESIKIAEDGNILDGQHRLAAIIKSGISLSFLIISELESSVFQVLDSGMKRTYGDIFYIAGISNAKNAAAAIRRYLSLKKGLYKVKNASAERLSGTEALSCYNSRIKFWDAAITMCEVWYGKFQRTMTQSEIAAFYAFFYDINKDDAFAFMELLCNGNNLDIESPIKQLRDKLIFSKANIKFTLSNLQRTALIFKAWNLFRENKTVKYLKFTFELDNYPVPV